MIAEIHKEHSELGNGEFYKQAHKKLDSIEIRMKAATRRMDETEERIRQLEKWMQTQMLRQAKHCTPTETIVETGLTMNVSNQCV